MSAPQDSESMRTRAAAAAVARAKSGMLARAQPPPPPRGPSPALQLGNQCRLLLAARAGEAAGYMLTDVFTSVSGLYLLARMHARNMRAYIRFRNYGPGEHQLLVADVVAGLTAQTPNLTVRADYVQGRAWSLTLKPFDGYAPMTLLLSVFSTTIMQALQTTLTRGGMTASCDSVGSWVRYGHFRYGDLSRAAISPGLVLAAVVLYTVSVTPVVRQRQLAAYSAALLAAAPAVDFHPRHTPAAYRKLCKRNVAHMREAARLFDPHAEWDPHAVLRAIAAMGKKCERQVKKATEALLRREMVG